jgi:hypothetical protein
VVTTRQFFAMAPDDGFRASQPEMWEFLRTRYRPVAFEESSRALLLGPSQSVAAP